MVNSHGAASRVLTSIDLRPHHGAGPIELGMDRAAVRCILGEPGHVIAAHQIEAGDTTIAVPARDSYWEGELQVHYDTAERVEFIEVFRGNTLRSARLEELELFSGPVYDLLEQLAALTGQPYESEDPDAPQCFTFPGLDLGLWQQQSPAGRDGLDSAGVGIPGYYSEEQI